MTESIEECWQCRLTSGLGLMGAGTYVVYQSKKLKAFSRYSVAAIGYGLGIIGMLKLFALPPFRTTSHQTDKENVEHTEENEYIIGKFPSKFQ